MPFRQEAADAGYALLLTLWVTAVLTLLLLTVSMQLSSSLKAAGYASRDLDAAVLARGAFWRVAAQLQAQTAERQSATPVEKTRPAVGVWLVDPSTWTPTWSEQAPETDSVTCWCQVTAEDAKAPIARLDAAALRRLPTVSPVLAEALASYIAGRTASGGVQALDELWQVDGMDASAYAGRDDLPGLVALVTPFHRGRIDINHGPAAVLRLLPGVDDQVATEIRHYLDAGHVFARVEDLQHIPGVTPPVFALLNEWVKVAPECFRVRATARVGSSARQYEGVFRVSKEGLVPLWLEGG